jgi:hypothetical protein
MLMPARGYSASMKQGMNNVTVMDSSFHFFDGNESVIKKVF